MSTSSAPTGAIEQPRTTLAQRFESIPESDYTRDVIAVVLLALSLVLPTTFADPSTPSKEPLFLGAIAIAAIALVFPYVSRFGLLPQNWTVARTRALRLILAVPFVALFLWRALGAPIFTDQAPIGVGSAFAVAGAGVALAAQARRSELGERAQDISAGKTARIIALLLAALIALGYVGSAIYLASALDVDGSAKFLVLALVVLGGAVVVVPAVAVAVKQTRAWITLLAGFGISIVAFVYLTANDAGSVIPQFETYQVWGQAQITPLSLALGAGLFAVPALAATAASPAFFDGAKRSTDVEERLDLAAIVLRVTALIGALLAIAHVLLAIFAPSGSVFEVSEGAVVANVATAIAGLILVAVAAVALRSFNRNPGTSRPPVAIALALTAALSIVLYAMSPFEGRTITHLFLLLTLPLLGVYALVGNKASREFYAQSAQARREPSRDAYVWAPQPASVKETPTQTTSPVAAEAAEEGTATGTQPVSPAQAEPVSHPASSVTRTSAHQTTELASPEPIGHSQDAEQTAVISKSLAQAPVRKAVKAEPSTTAVAESAPTESIDRTDVLSAETGAIGAGHGYTESEALDPATPAIVLAKIAELAPELRPALAKNPSTYPALVEWLGQLGDPAIDAALRERK